MATGTVQIPHSPFIDFGRGAIHTISTYGASWTATEDCWWGASMAGSTGLPATCYISGVQVGAGAIPANTYSVSRPNWVTGFIKKGQVFTTRNESTTSYSINFYALQRE